MSAHMIYDHAPLGSTISYSDGTPRPVESDRAAERAWLFQNGRGILQGKRAARSSGDDLKPASFVLNTGPLGPGALGRFWVPHHFGVDSDLTFEVVDRPPIGSVRIVEPRDDGEKLLHLADGRAEAELWLARNDHPDALLDEVTADEVAADVIEGRARP